MRTFNLSGINQLGTSVKLGKDVISFTDGNKHFSIVIMSDSHIQLTTAKGSYNLTKHPTLNYYNGICNNRKVQVHLKAISGWLKFW